MKSHLAAALFVYTLMDQIICGGCSSYLSPPCFPLSKISDKISEKLAVKVFLVDRFVFLLPSSSLAKWNQFPHQIEIKKYLELYSNILWWFWLVQFCSDKFVSRPYFGDTETVITVQQGEAAFFNCQVFNLANQTVSCHHSPPHHSTPNFYPKYEIKAI